MKQRVASPIGMGLFLGAALALTVGLGGTSVWAVETQTTVQRVFEGGDGADRLAPLPEWARAALDGPLAGTAEVVFAAHGILPEHWYANIGYYSTDENRPLYRKGGRLCKVNLRTGKLTVLLEDTEGGLRDPCVHPDGRQIVFSYRRGGTPNYQLYRMEVDGSGLRQIAASEFDDYEPSWLPDGGIVFVSTRAKRWVNCWLTQVGVIYRADGDGGNLRPLSANLEHDNTPWILPDGRILYTRWEYVDRSQVDYHHLWTMNPDGAGQTVFFGNLHPGGVFIDAKPIPGSDKIVLIHSPGHGQTEHHGFLAVLDARQGPDRREGLRNVTKEADFRDPWAFSEELFLAARDRSLVLVDGIGRVAPLFTLPAEYGDVWLHEPRPVTAQPVAAQLQVRTDLKQATGRFLLSDVSFGRNMEGVQRGDVRRLLVVESLPKPINFTGGMDPLSYKGTFTLERALGTVPVEADGSVYFEAPALRSLLFIALDAEGRAVKRMQSFCTVQPGETLGCLGCHESRTAARPVAHASSLAALRHAPRALEPLEGVPDLPDFTRHVQPVLDRLCVGCHNDRQRDGGVELTGDRGPMFSLGYYALTVWRQLADGRNYPKSNYPPRALGSGGAPLMAKLGPQHHGVEATVRERRLIQLWLDLGAPYPGTYAALGCGTIGGYIQNEQVLNNDREWPATVGARRAFTERCDSCHTPAHKPIPHTLSDEIGLSFWEPDMNDPRLKHNRHIVFNLTRPERSLLLLAPLAKESGGYGLCRPVGAAASPGRAVLADTKDPSYLLLRAMIENGRERLEEFKRFDMPGFRPRPEYVRELKRFGILPAEFDAASSPVDVYALDRQYWESLHYRPRP